MDDVERAAGALLAGPRGRRVCAEAARQADPALELPHDETDDAAARRLVEQLSAVDVTTITSLVEPLALMDVLGASVDSARYWQEPEERDQLLQDPRVVVALQPVAEALVLAPAAAWWSSPLALDEQSIVRWVEGRRRRADPARLEGAPERLQQWRSETSAAEAQAAREWLAAYDASCTGPWWSTPAHAKVVATTRRLGRLPAVQLELVEDAMGWDRARVASVDVAPDRRVVEIATPSDWVDLVDRYPLDVDRSRRHDWYRTTGSTGPWQIPDWAGVGLDHDAVHLTVVGYLATAGRALPTRHGRTVLAGFDPDRTYWLTDSLSQTEPPTTWRRTELGDDDHAWTPDPSTPAAQPGPSRASTRPGVRSSE